MKKFTLEYETFEGKIERVKSTRAYQFAVVSRATTAPAGGEAWLIGRVIVQLRSRRAAAEALAYKYRGLTNGYNVQVRVTPVKIVEELI